MAKYKFRNETEYQKLKNLIEEKLQLTESKSWQTRYRKQLTKIKLSWIQKQRIQTMKALHGEGWTPFGEKRFTGTKESLAKSWETRRHNSTHKKSTREATQRVQKKAKVKRPKAVKPKTPKDTGTITGAKLYRFFKVAEKIAELHKANYEKWLEKSTATQYGTSPEVETAHVAEYEISPWMAKLKSDNRILEEVPKMLDRANLKIEYDKTKKITTVTIKIDHNATERTTPKTRSLTKRKYKKK